ncbi:MAG TPA: DUF4919 domain-containing protein [Pyrinomonadaceae bacterium]|nr:DUF4919 domain-containing protein [Pyrinomonadaceae bacterium]
MPKLASTLFTLVLVSAVAFSSTQDPPKSSAPESPPRSFALLLERAKKSDPTLDFKDLRLAYTETTDYSPYGGDRETRKKMFAALNAKEFDSAVESAEKILAKNFVEINAHFVAYVAHRESGRVEKATFHKFMFDGLVKSITGTGDGKTAETAFVVITTDEEYTLFNILGLRPAGQALITQNGHSFDRMTATNPKTNETVVYFFNIDKPFNWLGQSLKK